MDWKADSSQQWTVSLGCGGGKTIHFSKVPVNTSIATSYKVGKPDCGANWRICAQVPPNFAK